MLQGGRLAGHPHSCSHSWWLISGQKAIAAKEQWKELKATYREHVEAIKIGLTKALTQMEEAQRKRTQLQEAFEQLQAKVHPGVLSTGREGQSDRKRERVSKLSCASLQSPKIPARKNRLLLLVPLPCLSAETSGHGETQSSPEPVATTTGRFILLGEYPFPPPCHRMDCVPCLENLRFASSFEAL